MLDRKMLKDVKRRLGVISKRRFWVVARWPADEDGRLRANDATYDVLHARTCSEALKKCGGDIVGLWEFVDGAYMGGISREGSGELWEVFLEDPLPRLLTGKEDGHEIQYWRDATKDA